MVAAMTRFVPLVGLAIAAAALTSLGAGARDPIADDIARWKRSLADDTVTVGLKAQVKQSGAPAVDAAAEALGKNRRSFALLRLGNARTTLEPGMKLSAHATIEDFKAERTKLAPRFDAKSIAALANSQETSAFGRALAQSSAIQGKETFDASFEYGEATEPRFGLYYLHQGVAYLDYARFAVDAGRTLRGSGAKAPALRSLAPEIRRLRDEMLAVYKPPLSIDRHPEFIGASSATKEALEYDAAGYREAALLRYLQAAVRFAPLRPDARALDQAALVSKVATARRQLADSRIDHSIGTLFLEVAEGDADTAKAGHAVVASAVVEDVLPRYFAALAPAPPIATKPAPEVTVTLVRWPYT